jgi:hypothetical protein
MNTDKFLVAALALGANAQQSTITHIRRTYHEHELNINRTYNELKELLKAQRGPRAAYLLDWFAGEPNSEDRRFRMEELFSESVISDEAIGLATRLVRLIHQDAPHIAEIAHINIDALLKGSDTFAVPESGGVSISGSGNITVGDVRAGVSPVNPWPSAGTRRND